MKITNSMVLAGISSALVAVLSCTANTGSTGNELVLCEGQQIEASSGGKTIRVISIDEVRRRYTTESVDIEVNLIKRWERWFGSLGAYKPSGTYNLHLSLGEGQQFFYSEDEALVWLGLFPDDREEFNLIYSPEGLVVAWSETESALVVDILQIYIQGEKPINLSGSNNKGIITLRYSNDEGACPHKGKFVASQPAEINGREYSGRAIDILSEQGVSFDKVEEIISPSNLVQSVSNLVQSVDYITYLNPHASFPYVVLVGTDGKVLSVR